MPEAILRLSLSRGITARGYSPKDAVRPAVVMALHPLPPLDPSHVPRWRVITASFRLTANDPLGAFKTANKLTQVLARAEADAARAQEAILLNTKGFLAEGTTSNLFWVKHGVVCTSPLASGALPGVTRGAIFDHLPRRPHPCQRNKRPPRRPSFRRRRLPHPHLRRRRRNRRPRRRPPPPLPPRPQTLARLPRLAGSISPQVGTSRADPAISVGL